MHSLSHVAMYPLQKLDVRHQSRARPIQPLKYLMEGVSSRGYRLEEIIGASHNDREVSVSHALFAWGLLHLESFQGGLGNVLQDKWSLL